MEHAGNRSDREQVIEVISKAFDQNPSVNQVIKNDEKRKKRIRRLSAYSYDTANRRDGVYISSDRKGVALCYKYNLKKEGVADYWSQVKLILGAIGISRVPEILKREAYLKSMRPPEGDFLYFWFLGVEEPGKDMRAVLELKTAIFETSDRLGLPLYLETSVPKNKRVYERYGFETYHEKVFPNADGPLWFMRRSAQ